MGWTGIPMGQRPKTSELNRIIDHELQHERCRILDRSGWLDHGRRQFLLMEVDPAPIHKDTGKKKFILMVSVDFSGGMFYYREDEESAGPNHVDCPMRLIRQVEDHPPAGEFAKKWRERVIAHHEALSPRRSVIRKLQKGDQSKLVLNDGRIVTYQYGRNRGGKVAAYRDPDTGGLKILKPDAIDAQATKKLWEGEQEDGATA